MQPCSIGHRGAYGHEFLDFEVDSTGKLKYHNNSEYKSDQLIRKQAFVSQTVIDEMRKIVLESGILDCKDEEWPKPDKIGKQELVVRVGTKEVSLQTSKIGSYAEVQKTKDPNGLTVFFYLVQDLKCFVFSLVNLHFRVPLPPLRSNPSELIALQKYLKSTTYSHLGKHRAGFQLPDPLAGGAVRLVKLVLAEDELEGLVAGEELAQLHAALVLGVHLGLVLEHLALVVGTGLQVLGFFGEVVVVEHHGFGDHLGGGELLLLAGDAGAGVFFVLAGFDHDYVVVGFGRFHAL